MLIVISIGSLNVQWGLELVDCWMKGSDWTVVSGFIGHVLLRMYLHCSVSSSRNTVKRYTSAQVVQRAHMCGE